MRKVEIPLLEILVDGYNTKILDISKLTKLKILYAISNCGISTVDNPLLEKLNVFNNNKIKRYFAIKQFKTTIYR